MPPIGIGWFNGGETIIIRAPNPAEKIARLRWEHPTAVIDGGWAPPDGLRPISQARYELLLAEAKVREEERAA